MKKRILAATLAAMMCMQFSATALADEVEVTDDVELIAEEVEAIDEETVEVEAEEVEEVEVVAVTAIPSNTALAVNGEEVSVDAYLIENSNYIKLRDIAAMVNGTEKNFETSWDDENNAIMLISATEYTPLGDELTAGTGEEVLATATTSPIYVDGELVDLAAYNIDGYNYFKIRDVMQVFDIAVDYDAETGLANLDTANSYVVEEVEVEAEEVVDEDVVVEDEAEAYADAEVTEDAEVEADETEEVEADETEETEEVEVDEEDMALGN